MIQWPSLPPALVNSGPPEPLELTLADARSPLGPFAPLPETSSTGIGTAAPELPVVPEPVARAVPAGGRGRIAIALSLAAHVALAAAFATTLFRDGIEPETDAISVEIVMDPLPQAANAAAVAGDAAETREAAASQVPPPRVEAEPVEEHETAQTVRATPTPAEPVAETTAAEPATALAEAAARPLEAATSELPIEHMPVEPAPQPVEPSPAVETASAEEVVPEAAAEPMPPVGTVEPLAPVSPERAEPVAPPVLAAQPSLEAMLPPLTVPPPPRLPEVALVDPAVPVPMPRPEREGDSPKAASAAPAARTPQKVIRASRQEAARKTASAKPATNERRPARESTAREKPAERPAAEAKAPARASAKGKSRETSRAGAQASVAASAGERESYGRKVNGHVQRYKRYPAEAARAGMKGAVRVSISIGGAGSLASARVTASSGHASLDREALATVRRAAPYPKPPTSFGGSARFSLTLRYSK